MLNALAKATKGIDSMWSTRLARIYSVDLHVDSYFVYDYDAPIFSIVVECVCVSICVCVLLCDS